MKIRKSSKVMALAICFAMLLTAMPFVALADEETSPITITSVEIDGEGDLLDVRVDYEIVGEIDQLTILATTTGYEVDFDGVTGAVTNISYIDQIETPSVENRYFTFKIAKADLDTDNTLYVRMGGSGVEQPAQLLGTFTEDSTGVLVFGYISVPGATVAISGGESVTTDADGRFEFVNITAGDYTLTITKETTGAIARTVPVTVADADVEVSTVSNKIFLIQGNYYTGDEGDGIAKINGSDLVEFLKSYNKTSNDDGYNSSANLFTGDEGDGIAKINGSDLVEFLKNYNRTSNEYIN